MTGIVSAPVASGDAADAPILRSRPRWLVSVLATWALIAGGLIIKNLGQIRGVTFHDPDDELRLVQVRDLLAGQGWFDLHQYRIAPVDGGVLMHWSRIVDLPLAAVIALLQPLFGQTHAELVALVAVPALTLLAIMALVGWMGARTLPAARHRITALVCVLFCAPVIMQVLPLRIDHHGWQIVMGLAAVAAFLVENSRKGGFLTGMALATWMSISLEGLPFAALVIAVLAGWALLDTARTARLVAAMVGLATGSISLFLATRMGDLGAHCDAISPVHLAIFAWGALAIGGAAMTRPGSRVALFAGLSAAGVGAVASMALAAPQCVTGTFDMLDPLVRSLWYEKVQEGQPVWHVGVVLMAQYAIPPLVGVWASLKLARNAHGSLREWWTLYAVILAGATVMAVLVARSAAFAGALAVLPLGWQLIDWIDTLKRPANPLLRVGELLKTAAMMFCAVLPAVPVMAVQGIVAPKPPMDDLTVSCSVKAIAPDLEALPPGGILAQLDFGPKILVNTHRSVLATGHHRGAKAMRELLLAFVGPVDAVPAIMARNSMRYLIVCPHSEEMLLYRGYAKDGLAARLTEERPPAWLKPVTLPKGSRFLLWELDPAAAAAPVRPEGISAPHH